MHVSKRDRCNAMLRTHLKSIFFRCLAACDVVDIKRYYRANESRNDIVVIAT